jgi:hydroxymethylpyrimidine pyrophosphatase-like HAD family hydrolase
MIVAMATGRQKPRTLTARELAFVEHYLLTANGAKAAEAAG